MFFLPWICINTHTYIYIQMYVEYIYTYMYTYIFVCCEAGSEASGLFSSTHKPKIHACETNVKHFSSWYSHVPCCGTASSRPIGVVWTLIHSWPLSSLGRLNIEVQPLTVNNQCTTGNLTLVFSFFDCDASHPLSSSSSFFSFSASETAIFFLSCFCSSFKRIVSSSSRLN